MQKVFRFCGYLAIAIALSSCSGSGSGKGAPTDPPETIPALTVIPDQESGSLNALKVAVSPAYGVIYFEGNNNYDFQRVIVNGIQADLYTQDFCFRYLYPSLERCGASVIALRDRDRSRIGVSGYEAWKESSLLYLTRIGAAAASLPNISDPSIRPWHAINTGADCMIHVSLNFSGSPPPSSARGTSLYVWTSQVDHSSVYDFSHLPPNNGELANAAYANIFTAAAAIDPTWRQRGILSGNFGVLRVLAEQHVAGSAHIPGILLELGFADNALDAEQLKTPAMMATLARAITVSVIDSLSPQAGLYPPMRPTVVSAVQGNGYIEVAWAAGEDPFAEPTSAPTSYVVKVSSEDGTYLGSRQVPPDTLSTRIPTAGTGTIIVTVSARNEHGESIDADEVSVLY